MPADQRDDAGGAAERLDLALDTFGAFGIDQPDLAVDRQRGRRALHVVIRLRLPAEAALKPSVDPQRAARTARDAARSPRGSPPARGRCALWRARAAPGPRPAPPRRTTSRAPASGPMCAGRPLLLPGGSGVAAARRAHVR